MAVCTSGRATLSGATTLWGNTVHYILPSWNLLSSRAPDGTVLGGNIVWGDNIVWGHDDNIVWGQNVIGPHGLNGGVER